MRLNYMFSEAKRTRRVRALIFGLAAIIFALLLLGLQAATKDAHAATTFTVNSTGDANDTNLGDGLCGVNQLPAPPTTCTLRAALQQAHVLAGADTINFNIPNNPNIPGLEVKTISPDSELPEIEEQVTINGYTQPGASPNALAAGTNAVLKIELDGSDAGISSSGLSIRASECVIKGLVINRFGHNGISISGPDVDSYKRNKIAGNFIGTDPSGTMEDLGNEGRGVFIANEGTSRNTVGGSRPAGRNLISGNQVGGVGIAAGAADNAVIGNLIGTTANGTGALTNIGNAVSIHGGASDNLVGGTLPETANTIAFNGGGVMVLRSDSTGNSILRNSMFSNDHSGIDLGGDGTTPNDPDDADAGPNNLQNKPRIGIAVNSGGETTVQGLFDSTPNKTFKILFFSNPAADPLEGKKYIGAKSVTTDANGNNSFTFKPDNQIPAGRTITATATRNSTGDTSEFSAPEEVV
jgi:CSLREA domain-containing protein